MNLTENELKILLTLHGNKRLDDITEQEIFKCDLFAIIYLNHLLILSNVSEVVDKTYLTSYKIYYLINNDSSIRWINAEKFLYKHSPFWWARYKAHFNIDNKYIP